MDWSPTRPRPGFLRRLGGRRRAATALVWFAAVAALVGLQTMRPAPLVLQGLVDVDTAHVASPVRGRVAAVLIARHDAVAAGQVVLRLDDGDVQLRLRRATSQLERLRAELTRDVAELAHERARTTAAQGLDASVERRRLATDLEAAQVEALATRAALEEARVRVQGASIEADRLESLVGQGMVGEPELVRVRTERDALQKRIGELAELHREQATRVATADERLRAFAPDAVGELPAEVVMAPRRWAIEAQSAELERIARDAHDLDLRAPIAGTLTDLTASAGEWVETGATVAIVTDAHPHRIRAYVTEGALAAAPPLRAIAVQRRDRTPLGATTVTATSPAIVRLPERLWRDPQRAEWGYEVVLAATGSEHPGEHVLLFAER